jgi:hypothetical protein
MDGWDLNPRHLSSCRNAHRGREKMCDRSEQAVGNDIQKWERANKSYSYQHSNDTDVEFRYFERHSFTFVQQLLQLFSAFSFRE